MTELDERILESKRRTDEVLKKVKESFANSVQAQIEYHLFMADEAQRRGDAVEEQKHRTLAQVYLDVLNRYSIS